MVTGHYLCILQCIPLTHWGRVTHICISKLTIIGWVNGLSPAWRQAIIWTNEGILLIRTLGTNFSEILSEIHSFSFKKMHLKMLSAKWRLFCLGLNELTHWGRDKTAAILQMTFQIHFLEWKLLYFDSNLTVCSHRSNWQDVIIGSDNGLVHNRWQAITWTNDDQVY